MVSIGFFSARVDRSKPILEIEDLTVGFDIRNELLRRVTHRFDSAEKVSLNIFPGETLALFGDSGSGRSTIGKTIHKSQDPVSGAMHSCDQDIILLSDEDCKQW